MRIDWQNPEDKISKYFKVKDACYLPSLRIYHTPSEQEQWNAFFLADKLDKVQDFLQRELITHCWGRPTFINCPGSEHHGKNYNVLVGGAQNSAHIRFNAWDGHAKHRETPEGCLEIRQLLVPELERLAIRLENRLGNWLHIDRNKVPKGGNYYFYP